MGMHTENTVKQPKQSPKGHATSSIPSNKEFGCLKTPHYCPGSEFVGAVYDSLPNRAKKNGSIYFMTNTPSEENRHKRDFIIGEILPDLPKEKIRQIAKESYLSAFPSLTKGVPGAIDLGRLTTEEGTKEERASMPGMQKIPLMRFTRMLAEHETGHIDYEMNMCPASLTNKVKNDRPFAEDLRVEIRTRFKEAHADGYMAAIEIRDSLSRDDYKETLGHLKTFANGRRSTVENANGQGGTTMYETADFIDKVAKIPPEKLRNMSNDDISKLIHNMDVADTEAWMKSRYNIK